MGLDLALRTSPCSPAREDDVDRIDAVCGACRAGGVRVSVGPVEVSKRGGSDEQGERGSRNGEGESMHVSRVGAAFASRVPTSSRDRHGRDLIARSSKLGTVRRVHGFDVAATAARLAERGGGYESIHSSPGLEVGVYLLVAGEEDKQTPHTFDEAYVLLDGEGEIEIEGERSLLRRGQGVFVEAGVEHRFHPYDELTLLVVFNGPNSLSLPQ